MKIRIAAFLSLLVLFVLVLCPQTRAQTPTVHPVVLTWVAPVTDAVHLPAATYNVYRSTTTGTGYAKISSATTPTFTDVTAIAGTKYFYTVTAVDALGHESPRSNEATATPVSDPNAPTGLVTKT